MKKLLVAIASGLAASVIVGGAGAARSESAACALEAGAPFLYVDVVFAPATIQCSSSQNRITVTTVLTRDGVEVARNTRHCTHTAVCHNDVGSWSIDSPGDQTWCTIAWGTAHAQTFSPVTVCEEEGF